MKLSVTVITLNEEKNLAKCLSSVKNLAGEIIIVDSGSTDETIEIAKKFKAIVFSRKFDNYSNQKNFAAGKVSGDWILSVDADEEISSELSNEIRVVIKDHSNVAYSIPRKNVIFGKFVRFTRWQPELDRHVWLWKKGMGKWVGDVHEELQINGRVGKLKNPKIHYQYETVTEFLEMMNTYSNLEVKRKFSYLKLFWDPLYNFFVRYFYRLGFLDGWRGFILSYLMGIYYLEVWVKAWEKKG